MKISGGKFKNKVIKSPKGELTRPTSGITRESIFNILGPSINKMHVLDLYSGCGTFGLEALSRGAEFCTFTEKDQIPLKCIYDNIKNMNVQTCTKVLKKELPEGLKSVFLNKTPDLIFMDPPYSKGFINQTLKELVNSNLVNEKTIIIAEHSKKEFPDHKNFIIKDTRKYGKSLVSFLNYVI